MKKILAIGLALVMMLSMFSMGFTVSAANTTKPADAPADAIAISTAEQLASMEAGKYYYLTADITLGTPGSLNEDAEGPIQDDWAEPAEEADMIVIPAGATLDGNGNTIYMGYYCINPGMYTSTNKFANSLNWTHSMFELAAGAQITIKNLNIGSVETPVYMCSYNELGTVGDITGNDIWGIFDDTEGSNVEWSKVNVYAERYGRGLGSQNTGVYMFKMLGTHNFTGCTLNTSTISAGSQAGAWFYRTEKSANLTMTNCSNEGFVISAGYEDVLADDGETVIGQKEVFLTPQIMGSYTAGYINYANGAISMTNCVNNVKINASYGSTAGHFSAFVNNLQSGSIYMEGCVNNANIDVRGLTIGGALVGRTGSASAITSFRLINCVNNGDITRSTSVAGTSSNHGYGGLVGHTASDGVYEVIGCTNYGDLTGATGNAGGVVGFAEGNSHKVITNCANYGDVTGTTNADAAGIASQLRVSAEVTGCVNYGAISCTSNNAGIVGRAWSGMTLSIVDSVNYGTIGNASTTYAAGFLATAIDNAAVVEIDECENYGSILSKQYSAGFVAENRNALTITNSNNFGEVAGVHAVGGFVGQTSNAATTTAYLEYCMNAGYIHQGPQAGEGIGGFFGRVAGTKATIEMYDCVNTGNIVGSTKATDAYGAFGDTFGQFIGLYTVNLAGHFYTGDDVDAALVGGFYDWNADGVVVPTIDWCYAYGTATHADGAKSLKGWITAEYVDGVATDLAQTSCKLTPIDVTEAPNDGVVGINVEYDGYVELLSDVDIADAIETVAGITGYDFIEGNTELGENTLAVAVPTLRGYQMSTDGTSIRFAAVINASTYEAVGFRYSAVVAGVTKATDKVVTTGTVWNSLNAAGADGTIEKITASEMGGKYITAITFNNIPELGIVKLTVTPVADDFEGETYEVTITHGVVTNVKVK